MAIIYTYPTKATPANDDLILISDSDDNNKTKKVKVSTLPGGAASGVSSVSALAATNSTGTVLTVTPTTGAVQVTPHIYNGGTNIGAVPTGGTASTFLRGDATWVTPTDTTYTAGDGLDLTGTEFSADLMAAGGLVINATELQVDLTAASLVGPLPATKGGTGQTSYTTGDVLYASGASAISKLPIGGATAYLKSTGSAPSWVTPQINDLSDGLTDPTTNIYLGSMPSNATSTLNNTVIGYNSSTVMTSAVQNVFVGSQAGALIETVDDNVGVGFEALTNLATGTGRNTAIGSEAGDNLTTGTGNTLIGRQARTTNATDSHGIAIGNAVTTSNGGVAIGRSANVTATDGIAIGASTTAATGGIALGNGATAAANEIELANIASSVVASGTASSVANQLKITINGTVYYIDLQVP